jgi:hypothetical protein
MKKKKYFNVYLNGYFTAIIKGEENLRSYLIDRATRDNYKIQRIKLSPIVEEFDIYADYNIDADVVETINETRYRNLILDEMKSDRKKCKKRLEKIKKKLPHCKKGSNEYRRLKSEYKMIKHNMNTILNEDNVQDAITDTIIHQPSAVKEYLENHELLKMISRGEI